MDDVDRLVTEQVRPELANLDARPIGEVVDLLLLSEARVPTALAAIRDQIEAAAAVVASVLSGGGRLVYAGAGTPGRLAALDAAECVPTFGTDPGQVIALVAGGSAGEVRAVEGAEDDEAAGAASVVSAAVGAGDVLVGITASGRTPFVLSALSAARSRGAATVAVVNNLGSPAGEVAERAIEVVVGPEVVAGSTRLSAGTSQKIVLNVLSTAAMVAIGKTYGAWMVDVQATNYKLRRRAVRILVEAAGVDASTAESALAAADGHTKTALICLLTGLPVGEARSRLDAAGGRVRVVVDEVLRA
jgi:N-acetylmuramic acid 6-phosphate etherase